MENVFYIRPNLIEWGAVFAGVFLFCGPGVAFLSFFCNGQMMDKTHRMVLGWAVSASLWSVFLSLEKILAVNLSWTTVHVFFALAWIVGLARFGAVNWRGWFSWRNWFGAWHRPVLWLVAFGSFVFHSQTLGQTVSALGSDGYHHTLIVQLIYENSGLPDTYLPYAPLVTFLYHFGFHAFGAFVLSFSNLASVQVTPISAYLVLLVVPVATSYFVEKITSSKSAGIVSALIVGLVFVFPGMLMVWSRYTQLMGMTVLVCFLGCFLDGLSLHKYNKSSLIMGVLAAGVVLAHYRVTLMAFGICLVLFLFLSGPYRYIPNGIYLARSLVAALIFCSPWLVNLIFFQHTGYTFELETPTADFFSLSRLGSRVLDERNNWIVLFLAVLLAMLSFQVHRRRSASIAFSAVLLVFLSQYTVYGSFMDIVSLSMLSFLFVGPFIAVNLYSNFAVKNEVAQLLRSVLIGFVVMVSMSKTEPFNLMNEDQYVTPADVLAMNWISQNTPENSLFAVNTMEWSFSAGYISGTDAGYWIPVLAKRQTATLPMIYPAEKVDTQEAVARLIALHRLQGDFSSVSAWETLRELDFSHVYVGERGGIINAQALENSPCFAQAFAYNSSRVFRILENCQDNGVLDD